jgi:4-hydroxyacetophenone monooxygenase
VSEAKTLDSALEAAHLPALMTALVHLTGDDGHLKPEWRPSYAFMARADIGVAEDEQAKMRAFARRVIEDYQAGRRTVIADLPKATIRRMMDFVTGVDIPEGYGDYLIDELALRGESSKDPRWSADDRSGAAKLHVVVVGAGMSGIVAGVRLRQAGVPFTIIEKNADVGGTWLENSYPGCRVDSSNHMYSYSFEPNHLWPYHFSTQPVLLDYFRGVAQKYELARNICFETEVTAVVWDDSRSVWTVHIRETDGRAREIEATAVITAVGQLNRPRLPEIAGRDSFAGLSFHSARWRHDVDLSGKRVAVIGTGASAFQFIPEIAGKVGRLAVFQRTPPWVFPTPNYHAEVPEGKKWALENVPFYDKWYRFWLLWMATDGLLPAVRVDPIYVGPPSAISEQNRAFRDMIAAAIATQAPGLAERVTPDYPIGGKRSLLDNGVYFQALQRDTVELVTDPIDRISPSGVVTADGTQRDFDVIIYGTGFQASRFLSPIKIVGRDGVDLHDRWAGDARAYLGITTPGFPNLFMIYGPNTNIVVNGSIIFFSECAVRYILGCLKFLANGAASVEVRKDVHDAFNERVDSANALMAWGTPNVTSWYKNERGRVSQNWPFALVDYWRASLAPDPGDFIVKAREAVPAAV